MGSYTESVPFIPEQGFRYCGGSDFKNWKECDLKGWVYCQAIPTPLYPFKCIVCPEKGRQATIHKKCLDWENWRQPTGARLLQYWHGALGSLLRHVNISSLIQNFPVLTKQLRWLMRFFNLTLDWRYPIKITQPFKIRIIYEKRCSFPYLFDQVLWFRSKTCKKVYHHFFFLQRNKSYTKPNYSFN